MPTEADAGAHGYLCRLLADGARPYRYRSRIRALLGHLESDTVKTVAANSLPVAAFSSRRRRSTGVPKLRDALTLGSQAIAPLPEGKPHAGRPAAAIGLDQSDAATSAADAVRLQVVVIPGSTVADGAHEAAVPDDDPTATRTVPAAVRGDAGGVAPLVARHEIRIPGVRDPRRMPAAYEGAGSLEIEPAPGSTAVHPAPLAGLEVRPFESFGEPSLAHVPGAAVAAERAAVAGPHPLTGRSSAMPAIKEPTRRPAVSQDPPVKPRQASAARSGIPGASSREVIPIAWTSPRSRRKDWPSPALERRAPKPVEVNQPSVADVAPREALVAAASPSMIIVAPDAGAGTPLAFWERRHLSPLRTRIRR